MSLSSEAEVIQKFSAHIKERFVNWRFQTEVPIGELTADGRIVEVGKETGVVKGVVAFVEAKGSDAGLREMITGLGQCCYYSDQSGCPSWLVLPHDQVVRILESQKKIDPRISIFDIVELKRISTEELSERMNKSRLKRKQERPMFKAWERSFKIVTITPIAITSPQFNANGDVLLNIGQRIRGLVKSSAQTIARSLSDACKYSLYVEPLDHIIGTKAELKLVQKYVPDSSGRSMKREFYELAPPREIEFTVRSIHPQLTAEIVENLLRQGGMFCGIGDSHTDGFHGRFHLME